MIDAAGLGVIDMLDNLRPDQYEDVKASLQTLIHETPTNIVYDLEEMLRNEAARRRYEAAHEKTP